jgi:hypothetical protein
LQVCSHPGIKRSIQPMQTFRAVPTAWSWPLRQPWSDTVRTARRQDMATCSWCMPVSTKSPLSAPFATRVFFPEMHLVLMSQAFYTLYDNATLCSGLFDHQDNRQLRNYWENPHRKPGKFMKFTL